MAAPAREALPESECEIVRIKARIAREACCCEDLQRRVIWRYKNSVS